MAKARRFARVLLDTGPLVAIISRHDERHVVCRDTLKQIEPPLLTCWPVLTEAAWLLRTDPASVSRLLRSGETGLFLILHVADEELPEIEKLSRRYRDLSPQLADVTLVHLAQREGLDTVFTLDRRDFSIYRYKTKGVFQLLPED